jgi:hypothetical protein
MEIKWEDPPETALGHTRNTKYRPIANELRKHPGRWAFLDPGDAGRTEKGASATAQNIRRGVMVAFPKDEFEAVSEGDKVWVRCLPKKEEGEEGEEKARTPVKDDDDDEPPLGEVRKWAKANGFPVADRGVLSRELIEQYKVARQRGLRAVPGT